MKPLFLIILTATSLCYAEPFFHTVSSQTEETYYLYDVQQRLAYRVSELKPHRVYVVYAFHLHKWVFAKTNSQAKFSSPIEAFAPGTILAGDVLGGNKNERYELKANAQWKTVLRDTSIQYRVWSDRKPSSYQVWYVQAAKGEGL